MLSLCIDSASGAWNSAQTWIAGDGLGPTGTRIIVDRVTINDGGGPISNISTGGSGGEFRISNVSGNLGTPSQFYTFCMQSNENIFLGQTVRVASISQQSIEPPISLNAATSVLYREYLRSRDSNSIFGVSVNFTNSSGGQTVHNALWYFQSQSGGVNNALAQAVTAFMASAAYTSLSAQQKAAQFGGVSILNLVKDGTFNANGNYAAADRRQDMLVYRQSLTTVIPEPAAAMLFFTGLVGCCGFLRRRDAS
jgi:hypothetical protein